jgi:hypothetical protein
MQDKAVRSLVIVVLVLSAALLGLVLLSWLGMAVMMGGGMMQGMMGGGAMMGSPLAATGLWLLALLVVVGVVAALVWALRTPAGRAE